MKSLVVLNNCSFTDEQKSKLGDLFKDTTFYADTTTQEDAVERIGNRNIVIMDQFVLTISEKILGACPNIELIILNTTAHDMVDIELLSKHGIKLAHVPGYATQDVAEVVLSMMLELNNCSKIGQLCVDGEVAHLNGYNETDGVKDIWPGHPIAPFLVRRQLKGQTVGIFGFGRIGQRCAEMCQALGMKVLVYNRSPRDMKDVKFVSANELFKESDVIIVAQAYQKGHNDRSISRKLLESAKNDALLLSIAHPSLVDMAYLIENPDKFRGIGFDYLVTSEVRKLMSVRKHGIIITPHLGSQSFEAQHNMTESMIFSALSFSRRKFHNIVN